MFIVSPVKEKKRKIGKKRKEKGKERKEKIQKREAEERGRKRLKNVLDVYQNVNELW